jgi:hypothetical protein
MIFNLTTVIRKTSKRHTYQQFWTKSAFSFNKDRQVAQVTENIINTDKQAQNKLAYTLWKHDYGDPRTMRSTEH